MNTNHMDLLINPTGHNMNVMAERFMHVINKINPAEIKVLLEIGSMDAWESANMARVFTDAHIHCFEPVAYNFGQCRARIAEQPSDISNRIHLHNIAMNDATGPMEFWELDIEAASIKKLNHGIASKFKLIDPDMWPWEHNQQRMVTVEGWRLDDWCNANNIARVDGIWMDAQGAELDILKGAGTVLNGIQFVMTEAGLKPYYHGHTMKSDMDAYMAGFGFTEWKPATVKAHEFEVDLIYLNTNLVNF